MYYIFGLFNDVVNSLDYIIATDDRINELGTERI
jgi:hypothetical protein